MMVKGTLLSSFRREKARQYQKFRKNIGVGFWTLLLTVLVIVCIQKQPWVDIPDTLQAFHRPPPLNFTDLRECRLPHQSSPLVKLPDKCVYIYSALAHFRDNYPNVLVVTVNAWDGTYTNSETLCCFRSKTDSLTVLSHRVIPSDIESSFRAKQFSCLIDTSSTFKPTHVTLGANSCSLPKTQWTKILYPDVAVNELAVCAGVVSGKVVPERVAEWFELQKVLGVTKVLTFTYMVHPDTMEVLEYYEKHGMLKMLPYDIPQIIKAKPDRGFKVKDRWYPQYHNDEQVAILHCQRHLHGYRYVMFSHFNEVIVPRGEILNLYDLLEYRLKTQHKTASSFSFPVKTFITEWNKSDPDNELFYLQYLLRLPINRTTTKSIYIPSRMPPLPTPVHLNYYYYEGVKLTEDIASLHVYRECQPYSPECMTSLKYHDGDLFTFEKILRHKMADVPSRLRREF